MRRNLRTTLSLLLLSLLSWQCKTGQQPEQTGERATIEEATATQVSDQLLLPFPPNWGNTNPPLLYYGRDARFLDPRYRSDALNILPADRNRGDDPVTQPE